MLISPRAYGEFDEIAGRPALQPPIADVPRLQLREERAGEVIGRFGLRARVGALGHVVLRVDPDEVIEIWLLEAKAVRRACPAMARNRDIARVGIDLDLLALQCLRHGAEDENMQPGRAWADLGPRLAAPDDRLGADGELSGG